MSSEEEKMQRHLQTPSKSVLRAAAKEFVFSPNAACWTPDTLNTPRNPLIQSNELDDLSISSDAETIDKANLKFCLSAEAKAFFPGSGINMKSTEGISLTSQFNDIVEDYENMSEPFSKTYHEPQEEPENSNDQDVHYQCMEDEIIEKTTKKEESELKFCHSSSVRYSYTLSEMFQLRPQDMPIPAEILNTTWQRSISNPKQGPSKERPSSSRRTNSNDPNSPTRRLINRNERDRSQKNQHGHPHSPHDLMEYMPLEVNEETRWKPSCQQDDDGKKKDNEGLLKQAKSILNKLSVEKFDHLSDSFIRVAIQNEYVLENSIEMIVEKAQMEWHFSSMYAELCCKISCSDLSFLQDGMEDGNADPNRCSTLSTGKRFRKILLGLCQKQFQEERNRAGFELLSEDERCEKELILKRETLGHIRFIGELYKQNMISSRIMHDCVQHLFGNLENPDEESLECLCKLLTTIGKKLESNLKKKVEMDLIAQYYTLITNLSQSKKLITRIRFMLQDLLELRQNLWVARRQEVKAKTIAEIHAEAAQEAKEKQSFMSCLNTVTSSRRFLRSDSQPGRPQDSSYLLRGGSNGNGNALDDCGWETVSSFRSKNFFRSKSCSKNSASIGTLPSRGKLSSTYTNRVTCQKITQSDDVRKFSPKLKEPNSITATNTSSSKNSACLLSNQEFKSKLQSILKEYISTDDTQEAITCIKELNGREEKYTDLMIEIFNLGLEKDSKERQRLNKLSSCLIKQNFLAKQHVHNALKDLLEFLDDLLVDIPKAKDYIVELMIPLIDLQVCDLDFVIDHCFSHELEADQASLFILALMKGTIHHYSKHGSKSSSIIPECLTKLCESKRFLGFLEKQALTIESWKNLLQHHHLHALLPFF